MKKTKVNQKTQPTKKLVDLVNSVDSVDSTELKLVKNAVKLKSAKYAELQAEAEQIKALHEQNATKQKKVNYEDLKLALVKVSEQMKKFLNENSGDYRIRRVYKVNYDIERLIKGF